MTFRKITFSLLLVAAAATTGCNKETPVAGTPEPGVSAPAKAEPSAKVELQRAFLSKEVSADGVAHEPAVAFAKGAPIYLTVMLAGSADTKVEAVLRHSETDQAEIARSGQTLTVNATTVQTVPLEFGDLAEGNYHVTVLVDGAPSWALPFSVGGSPQ